MFKTNTMPRIIAVDDWMVWGEAADGVLVETCAEMWPEWLEYQNDPSDMQPNEYCQAIFDILKTKRPEWTSVADMETLVTKRWNAIHGVSMSEEEVSAEVQRLVDGIRNLALSQELPS